MSSTLILLVQVLLYSAFPFYFTTLPYYRRNTAFYAYLSIVLVLGGFLGSVYSFPITDTITISGGNLTYGVFMMTIIMLVMLENDLDVIRIMIRLVITVNIFVFFLFTTLVWALNSQVIANPFNTDASIFAVSIPFMILGGTLIIIELLIFLFLFEHIKRWISNITILAILYTAFYIITLAIDGILFPLIALIDNPALVDIIYGNVSGKLVMGAIFSIPILLFLAINRKQFATYAENKLDFVQLFTISRQELQVALSDSEKRYRLLVDSSPYAIGVYQDEKFVFVNDAACHLLGVDHYTDLLTKPYLSIVPPKFHANHQKQIQKLLNREQAYYSRETVLKRKDNSLVPVELIGVPINYNNQPAIQMMAHDITERQQAETVRQEAVALQIELDKERELRELKSRFTSMIVHDFRNPVASVILSAQLIPRYLEQSKPENVTLKVDKIIKTAQRLNGLIDEVLELGRMETLETNFAPISGDIVAFLSQLFSEFKRPDTHHNYQYESSLETATIDFDPELMRHAVTNLLTNAVKYSPNGGEVKMRVSQEDTTLLIQISDNGIGIPEEEIARIFDFFHRANNANDFKGTGIGLAVVKQVIETHNGTIICNSALNQGTTFTISLPIDN